MFFRKFFKQFCSMDTPFIQDEGNLTRDRFSNAPQKTKDIFSSNIVFIDRKEKIELVSLGRDANGGNNRQPLMTERLIEDRSLSFRCSSASEE